MIRTEGAPVDLGRAQGRARRAEIETAVARLRDRYGPVAWLVERRRAKRRSGRTLARQLPQQAERVDGIAAGAGVSGAALLLGESLYGIQGTAWRLGTQLHASFELASELVPLLALRTSRPDAGGFPSVELVCATFAGCLAGVNSEGFAALCLADRERGGVSLRFLAQELIFRSGDLRAAVEHLRRRARYTGGSGELLLADAAGAARRAVLVAGSLQLQPVGPDTLALEPDLRIDTHLRTIRWAGPGDDGSVRPPAALAPRSTSAR